MGAKGDVWDTTSNRGKYQSRGDLARGAGNCYTGNMPPTHPATLAPEQLLKACSVQRLRRGGPGGQHRNKVETAVVIEHLPTGIRAEANERRSQADNHRQAVFRLRVLLAIQVRPVRSGASESTPSKLWQSRISADRIAINPTHDDFPALLAEAFDQLAAQEFDVKAAAESLCITTSQLAKFLKKEPAAWQHLNDERRERGLPSLR